MMTRSLCCIMVVTAIKMMMVCAAPAASVSPSSDFAPSSNFVCGKPGIFADQDTGCQVFHFCQDDGRMDSFFCPNQTLFNQQFFVCDWFYNVDCSIANQFYHLNDALYLYQAEDTLSRAIEPAIKISQDEILTGSSSQLTSHSATSLHANTQLDAGPSSQAIVVDGNTALTDSALPPEASAQPLTSVTNDNTLYDPADPEPVAVLSDNYIDPSSDPEPAAYYTDPYFAGVNSAYNDPTSDPEPDSYTPALTSYSDNNVNSVYSDPYTDPEPAYTSDPYTDPEPASYTPVLATYSDPSTDPEPVYASDPYTDPEPVYSSDPYTDPEPASYSPVLTSYTNDPVTDPEPATFYSSSGDPYSDPEPPAYFDASDLEPYAGNYQGYDPAPATAYQQQPVVYSNSKLYDGDQYVLPTYQSNLVDQSDPEPAADPEYSPY